MNILSYLFSPAPNEIRPAAMLVHGLLIVLLLGGALIAARRRDRTLLGLNLVSVALAFARIIPGAPLMPRALLFLFVALSAIRLLISLTGLSFHARSWISILALQPWSRSGVDPRATLVLLAVHLLGLSLVWLDLGKSPATSVVRAILALGLLLLPQVILSLWRRNLQVNPGVLTPLFLLYACVLTRFVFDYTFHVLYPPFASGEPIDLQYFLLTTVGIFFAVVMHIVLIYVAASDDQTQARWRAASRLALLLTACWAAVEYLRFRTRGVTGSDPYAYAQMAVDWVETGSFRHFFALPLTAFYLGAPIYATVHTGYLVPLVSPGATQTVAPSVWPTGFSVLLGLAYRNGGEAALYLTAPGFGLLMLPLMWALAMTGDRVRSPLIALIATFTLATSFEQIDRSLVPMADVPAQWFTTASVLLTLLAVRPGRSTAALIVLGSLAGASFGMAYWIRHTQLLIGAAIVVAVAVYRPSLKLLIAFLVPCGIAALLMAIPDLLYHKELFGSYFHPESEELQFFGPGFVRVALGRLQYELGLPHELGFVFIFTIIGAIVMAIRDWRLSAVMLAWLLPNTVFHSFYQALRLRDLQAEIPVIALWTAWGAWAVLQWSPAQALRGARSAVQSATSSGQLTTAARALSVIVVLVLFSLRSHAMLVRTLHPHRASFGYMEPDERAVFDTIAMITPASAVIVASDHSGPIDLYSHREFVRAAEWSGPQLDAFVQLMAIGGREVYLLYDGGDEPPLAVQVDRLYQANRLEPVQWFSALVTHVDYPRPGAGTLYRIQSIDPEVTDLLQNAKL